LAPRSSSSTPTGASLHAAAQPPNCNPSGTPVTVTSTTCTRGTPYTCTAISQVQTPCTTTSTTTVNSQSNDATATYYWPNQQSARLMFYHDHSYGLTRLNVYAGEAAGYVLTDDVEQAMIGKVTKNSAYDGVLSNVGIKDVGVPLIIQDKTFVTKTTAASPVPMLATKTTDPLWGATGPTAGTLPDFAQAAGALWFPHVYQPNQLPLFGMNPKGRWDYGAWVHPPATIFSAKLPTTSIVPEAFMDTMLVNGVVYPYMEVPQAAVRFRILNASNDRTLNLQLYYAVTDAGGFLTAPANRARNTICNSPNRAPIAADKTTGAAGQCNEVAMIRATGTQSNGQPYTATVPGFGTNSTLNVYTPADNRWGGVPDPTLQGPPFIQIGTEGGLLPAPAVHFMQAVDYEYDPKNVNALNIRNNPSPSGTALCPICVYPYPGYTLWLMAAQRADVIIDFSQVPDGSTLILYNDAPAAVPGKDPRLDYYTLDPDQTANGGALSTKAGFGPNTRTVMQFRVKRSLGAGTTALNQAWVTNTLTPALAKAFADSHTDSPFSTLPDQGASDPVQLVSFSQSGGISNPAVPCNANATNVTDPTACASIRICEFGTSCVTAGVAITEYPTCPTNSTLSAPDPITGSVIDNHSDPGYRKSCGFPVRIKSIAENFDPVYGRMNAQLGTELAPFNAAGQQTFGFYYVDKPTENLPEGETEIWNIVHNGVDSHAIHFHLMNVQLINRVDWAGIIKTPDPEELGWRETLTVNPLENIIVAVRATKPTLPWLPVDPANAWTSCAVNSPTNPKGCIPNSYHPLDVTEAISTKDPNAQAIFPFTITQNDTNPQNVNVNFQWEYVWHCHILGHEENDMMRPLTMCKPGSATGGAPNASATCVN
jgi:FtsP/CotA-like multicopper oxidase with cupredoxin domain